MELRNAADGFVGKPRRRKVYDAVVDGRAERIAHRARLLVDLLHHEVFIAALFRRLRVPGDLRQGLFDDVAVDVVKLRLAGRQLRHFQIVDVIDAAAVLEDGRHVRGEVRLPLPHADDHRAVLARGEDLAGIVLEHHRQRVRAAHAHHRLGQRVDGAHLVLFVVVIDSLDEYLGIRLRIEAVPLADHLRLQFLIVLDDAVVYADDVHVVAAMRMGVDFARLAVRRPARVAHAAGAGERLPVVRLVRQHAQAALGLDDLRHILAIAHHHARRVIAAVFQLRQPCQQDRRRLFTSCISYDAAHMYSSPHCLTRPRKAQSARLPSFPSIIADSSPFEQTAGEGFWPRRENDVLFAAGGG